MSAESGSSRARASLRLQWIGSQTRAGQLAILDQQGVVLNLIVLREPRTGKPDETKYVVGGKGHDESVHSSLDDAKAAAEESIDAS